MRRFSHLIIKDAKIILKIVISDRKIKLPLNTSASIFEFNHFVRRLIKFRHIFIKVEEGFFAKLV